MKKYIVLLLLCLIAGVSLLGQSKGDLTLEDKLQAKIGIHVEDQLVLQAVSAVSQKADIRITNTALINPIARIPFYSDSAAVEEILQRLLDRVSLTFVRQQNGSLELAKILPRSTVYGNIFDKRNTQPLPFADVFLENTSLGSTTDENGKFEIQNIPRGIYTLHVRFIGYEPQTFRLNLKRGKLLGLNIFLKSSVVEMQQVEVGGTNKKAAVHKVQISGYTLKPIQMDLQPSFGEKDILRSLQMLPGVTATNDYKSQLYIRGGNSDQNLVLMNGGILYNPFHFSGIMSAFDPDALESADIYLGGFSSEYGGRLSSVLDIRTRRSGDHFKGRLNFSPISSKLLLEFPDEKRWGSFLVSYRRSSVNAFSEILGGRVEPDFYDLIINHDIHPPGKMRFSFTGFLSKDKVTYQKGQNNNPIESNNKLITANIDQFQSKNLSFHSDISLGQFYSSLPPSQGVGKSTHNKLTDGSVTLKMAWQPRSNLRIESGIDYRTIITKYTSADFSISKINADETTYDRAFYIQARYQLNDKIDFDNGIRLQSYRPHEPILIEPRLSMRYKLYNFLVLKGSYGRFSQNLVTIYNENDTYNPVDIWISPPASLKYSTADHYILGLAYNTTTFNLTVETYLKKYHHLTHYNRERLTVDDPFFIQGEGTSYGLDISAQIVHDKWQLLASYSLAKATKTLPFKYPEPHQETFAPRYDRRHSLNLNLSAKPVKNLEINTKFTLGTGLPFTFITGYYVRLPGEYINPPSDFINGDGSNSSNYLLGIKSDINAFRFPTYHRLDLSIKYTMNWHKFVFHPYLLFLNLYDQKNVLFYDAKGNPHWSLPFLPMVGVNVEF